MDAECIICLESNSVTTKKSFYFVKNNIYLCNCRCMVYTHAQCMQAWLENSPKCPICRYNLYQVNALFIYFCKTLMKSCAAVFLILIYIIHISNAVQEEIRFNEEIRSNNFNITLCRCIIMNITNITVKSI